MDVFIIGIKDDEIPVSEENHSVIEKMIKSHLKMKDVIIDCNDNLKIIALFEKADEEIESFENDLNTQSAYVSFEHI